MDTKIERTWWFRTLCTALAALAAVRLMQLAGIDAPYRLFTWVLFGFCLFGLQRLIAFAGSLVVLCLPKSLDVVEPVRKVPRD